jgi:hypothetical protein
MWAVLNVGKDEGITVSRGCGYAKQVSLTSEVNYYRDCDLRRNRFKLFGIGWFAR